MGGDFLDLELCRQNKARIIELVNELIEELEAEEAYWKDNMPYYCMHGGTLQP